ncbi:MAG: hypothetical protein NHB15_06530 [Methanosarcina barkeri]|nr:hypothetical protein [Methanosarcina sp. ERenArc_MAG2]MCO5381780.1 hypothetical protein [Methanosarcina sp. ERenArc_MAG2]
MVLLIVFCAGCSEKPQTVQQSIEDAATYADETTATLEGDTLKVVMFSDSTWSAEHFRDIMFSDTVSILGTVKNYPEINTVKIDYQGLLLDTNKNEFRDTVFQGEFSTAETNQVGWENVGMLDQEEMLQKKAGNFWVHPALK